MAVVSLFRRTFSNRAFCFKKVKRRMFHTFRLKDILIKRLKDINISNPTPIQEKVSRMERSHGLRKVKFSPPLLEFPARVFIIEFGWREGSIPSKIFFSLGDEIVLVAMQMYT